VKQKENKINVLKK